MNTESRVAVTGLGVVSGFGSGVKPFWESLLAGKTALRPLGSVPGPLAELYVARVDKRDLPPVTGDGPVEPTSAMLYIAAAEAVADSGLPTRAEGARYGLSLGTCQGVARGDGPGLLPLRGTRHVADMYTRPADDVARRFGLHGPQAVISTACASSTTALGWAAAQIRDGRADAMLAGGAESLCLFALAGFHGMRATSPGRCAPYTVSDGMSIGEGAAVLVLENWDHAIRRRATILAEFLGCGMSADAYHAVAPDPTAHGAVAAARRALASSGLEDVRIDYVSGHGTGTANNDAMEKAAMILLFGERAGAVPISSIKSAVGHTLGATGAMEAVASVLALRDGILPPTVGAAGVRDDRIDIVPDRPRHARLQVVLSNSYAFGGNNASILLAAPDAVLPRRAVCGQPGGIVVTGVGAVGSAGLGQAAWLDVLSRGRSAFDGTSSPIPPPAEPSRPEVARPNTWHRMDDFTRRAVAAAAEALRNAGIDTRVEDEAAEAGALMFATAGGPIRSGEKFGCGLSDSIVSPRPTLFAQTTMTAAPGTLGICLGLRGPAVTFLSGGASGLQALDYACSLIARGEVPYALIVGCDEITDQVLEAQMDWWGPGLWADGAVALVVESAARARRRGQPVLALADGSGQAGGGRLRAASDAEPTVFQLAMRRALMAAGSDPVEVDFVLAAAHGEDHTVGRAEVRALAATLPPGIPVGRTRPLLGEMQGAGGLADVLTGIFMFQHVLRLPSGQTPEQVRRVLINAASCGSAASTILSAPEPGAVGA